MEAVLERETLALAFGEQEFSDIELLPLSFFTLGEYNPIQSTHVIFVLCAVIVIGGYKSVGEIKDTQPSQTCSGGFIKTQLYATCCCFFAIGEYILILSNRGRFRLSSIF